MFSSDKNISIIGKLIELAKHYIGLQNEYLRLDVIDKIVRLITALIIVAALSLIIILILIFLSLSVVVALSGSMGFAWAFCTVGLFYFVAFLVFLFFKEKLIEKPLVKFLTTLLMEK